MFSRQLNRVICASARKFVFKRLTSSKNKFTDTKKVDVVQTLIEFKNYIKPKHIESMLIIGTTALCVIPKGKDEAIHCFLRGCVGFFCPL